MKRLQATPATFLHKVLVGAAIWGGAKWGQNGRIDERGVKRGLKGVREMLQKNEWRKEYLFKKKES